MKTTKISLVFSLASILIYISFITGISFAWVNTDPLSSIAQNGLNVTFVNTDGYRMVDPIVLEKDIYPGWFKTYRLYIKNFGNAANYKLGIDFPYDKNKNIAQLVDAIQVSIAREGQQGSNHPMSLLVDKPLLDNTGIQAQETQNFILTFRMDEMAGDEYQGLSLNLNFIITADPVSSHSGGGYNSGAEGSETDSIAPVPTTTPDPNLQEPPLPDRGGDNSLEDIPDESVPAGLPADLPKTGGLPAEYMYSLGIVSICTGFGLKLRRLNH